MAWISCLHARLAARPAKNHLSHRIYWQLRRPAAGLSRRRRCRCVRALLFYQFFFSEHSKSEPWSRLCADYIRTQFVVSPFGTKSESELMIVYLSSARQVESIDSGAMPCVPKNFIHIKPLVQRRQKWIHVKVGESEKGKYLELFQASLNFHSILKEWIFTYCLSVEAKFLTDTDTPTHTFSHKFVHWTTNAI